MFLSLSIFFISAFAACAMILFRYWEIEKGKITAPAPRRIDFCERWHVCAEWEKKIWDEAKKWSIRFSALVLKFFVIGIDKVRIEMRKLIARMEDALTKKHMKDSQGSSSFFLKDIAEHKKKIRMSARSAPEDSVFTERM